LIRDPIVDTYIHDRWQQTWKSQPQNKLYQISPTIPSYSTLPTTYRRKDQVLYNRLRMEYTHLTFLPYWTHRTSKMYKL